MTPESVDSQKRRSIGLANVGTVVQPVNVKQAAGEGDTGTDRRRRPRFEAELRLVPVNATCGSGIYFADACQE